MLFDWQKSRASTRNEVLTCSNYHRAMRLSNWPWLMDMMRKTHRMIIACKVDPTGNWYVKPMKFRYSQKAYLNNWLVVYLPLWKIWVRQLGWWNSQLNGQIQFMFQTTNQITSDVWTNLSNWSTTVVVTNSGYLATKVSQCLQGSILSDPRP